jgi:hypothetical protein
MLVSDTEMVLTVAVVPAQARGRGARLGCARGQGVYAGQRGRPTLRHPCRPRRPDPGQARRDRRLLDEPHHQGKCAKRRLTAAGAVFTLLTACMLVSGCEFLIKSLCAFHSTFCEKTANSYRCLIKSCNSEIWVWNMDSTCHLSNHSTLPQHI